MGLTNATIPIGNETITNNQNATDGLIVTNDAYSLVVVINELTKAIKELRMVLAR